MTMDSVLLSRLTAALSGAFAAALLVVGIAFASQLALAQAADSAVDFGGALILSWVVQVAQRPRDADHPWGHSRAEPIGALVIAMMAAVLAVQVALSAFRALADGATVEAAPQLIALFAAKVAFKGLVFAVTRRGSGPALRALSVDARNDVLVGLVSVIGFFGMRAGFASWDAWLSFPVSAWIFWSGLELGRENVALLMGTSPPARRLQELTRIAEAVPGVIAAYDLRAHHLGADVSVHVSIGVSTDLTVGQGHDVGEAVRAALEREPDVLDCAVHVDPFNP